jgi:hypothetical protein
MTLTRKRHYPQVATYKTPDEIVLALRFGTAWRPDPLKEALDVMMSPRKMQQRIDDKAAVLGDCDDHAIYWATALLKSGIAERAWLGTVWYQNANGKGTGHVVCVWERWNGALYWSDYSVPQPFTSEWCWARAVASRRQAKLIAAGYFQVMLRKSGEPRLCKRVHRKIF